MPADRENHPSARSAGAPVDLRKDGLLWLINTVVFHPRGFALAWNPTARGDEKSPEFVLLGDGSERWSFSEESLPSGDDLWNAVEAAFERARKNQVQFSSEEPS